MKKSLFLLLSLSFVSAFPMEASKGWNEGSSRTVGATESLRSSADELFQLTKDVVVQTRRGGEYTLSKDLANKLGFIVSAVKSQRDQNKAILLPEGISKTLLKRLDSVHKGSLKGSDLDMEDHIDIFSAFFLLNYAKKDLADNLIKRLLSEKTEELSGLNLDKVKFSSELKQRLLNRLEPDVIRFLSRNHRVLKGHSGWINSVCFSPNGKQLATGSRDTTACVWNVETGACVHKLSGHTDWINSVCFSLDGRYIATGSLDKTVRIWDAEVGKCIKILSGGKGNVNSVCFSPDGEQIAAGSYAITYIWNVETGENIKTLPGGNSACFSPDGKYIATAGTVISIWDVETGKCIQTLRRPYCLDSHSSVCFSPDGKRLAAGLNVSGTVCIWDVEVGKCIQTLSGDRCDVNSVCFSPDGEQIAAGLNSGIAHIWQIKDEKLQSALRECSVSKLLCLCKNPDTISSLISSKDEPGSGVGYGCSVF